MSSAAKNIDREKRAIRFTFYYFSFILYMTIRYKFVGNDKVD
jgi:hypothetical protein